MECEDRYLQVQRPKYDCLMFDLDDTLYPRNSGLSAACAKNITDYMDDKLGIEKSKISDIGNSLYKTYGTTMAGLRAIGYKFDYDEYHSLVHGRLPYEKLKPDYALRNLLLSLPYRKVIFTNGDKVHAAKVLNKLGLEDCFEGIICFETLNPSDLQPASDESTEIFDILGYFAQPEVAAKTLPNTPVVCKPSEDAMLHACKIADVDPQRTIFFDDSIRNVQSGKRIGLHTVLVGTCQRVKGADHSLENIHNMKEALPELWADAEKLEDALCTAKVAIETSVIA